jgi:hypothetical protein
MDDLGSRAGGHIPALAVVILTVFVGASSVAAQAEEGDAPDGEDDRQAPSGETTTDVQARELFVSGREAFEGGRYEEALQLFQTAYDISQRHLLLYNVGQAQDRLRQDREALESFERYIELNVDPPYSAQVESRIRALRGSIARDEELRAAAAAATPEPTSPITEPPPTPSDSQSPITSEWWFWAGIGGGVALVALATVLVVVLTTGGTSPPVQGDVGGVVMTLGAP